MRMYVDVERASITTGWARKWTSSSASTPSLKSRSLSVSTATTASTKACSRPLRCRLRVGPTRGTGFRYYTEQLAALPYVIGSHYFQYWDEPITGRFDMETAYNGFVNVADIASAPLVAAARATNARIYAVHAGVEAPFAVAPRPS